MGLEKTLDASMYLDPDVFERERHAIFRRAWVMVGFEQQIEQPGDYFTENVAGWPIFVQRGDDGALRAFENLCPHRAGPIVWDGTGCQANLVCRYHGWSFDSNGRLRNARDFGADEADMPSDLGLPIVRVQSWQGLIFVCFDSDVPDLIEWLGGFVAECADYRFDGYVFHSRTVRAMACNWKTYADNFLEGYHVPLIHPVMNREIDGMAYEVVGKGDPRWNFHIVPQRDRAQDVTFTGVFAWFWPTFSFDIFPGGFAIERWLPRGPHHSDLIFEYFFEPGTDGIDEMIKTSEDVADEDVLVAEHVQRNMAAGTYRQGVLSPKHEHAIVDFKRLVNDALENHDASALRTRT